LLLRNRHRHLDAGIAAIGQPWMIDVFSTPGYATLDHQSRLGIALALLTQPLAIPGIGSLWLDVGRGFTFTNGVVVPAVGHHRYVFVVPAVPALAGVSLHVQALLEQTPTGTGFTDFATRVVQ